MNKRKVILLTDISSVCAEKGEPDDTQSLLRALLYTDQIEFLSMIATYTPHVGRAAPELLHMLIELYGKAYPQLARSGGGFAAPDTLQNAVTAGDHRSGAERIGSPSGGARQLLEAAVSCGEPLWILAWGGVTDLAQAVALARREMERHDFEQFIRKLRVYAIGDQYDDCGPWLRKQYPELFYIVPHEAYRGMYRGGDPGLCSADWVRIHVLNAAPYGSAYPLYDGGDIYSPLLGAVHGVKEGDTPSLLHLIENGLNDPGHPETGGWGGRFEPVANTRHYSDAFDILGGEAGPWRSVNRWRADFQEDFAARLALAAGRVGKTDYPVVDCGHDSFIEMEAGQSRTFALRTDRRTEVTWMLYPEAGTFKGTVLLKDAGQNCCELLIPATKKTGRFYLIASASHTDGVSWRSYKRFEIHVRSA